MVVRTYEKYYKIKYDENGYMIAYQRQEKMIKEQIDKAGYFVIVTSKEMSALEALNKYRDRDAIEKVFRMEKSYLGCDVFRVHNEAKLESKVFISFIGLILRNEIHRRIKPLYEKNRKEYTVPKVLQQIDRVGLTKLSDNKYHVRYKLTNKQKMIMNAFEIKENEYNEFAKEEKSQIK